MSIQPTINYSLTDSTGKTFTEKEWIDYAIECNFLSMEIPAQRLPQNQSDADEIISYALQKGLALSIHAPFGSVNIADINEDNRKYSIEQIKNSIDLASKHKLKVVTFHPGRLSSENEDSQKTWERLLAGVREIAEYAKEKMVYVGLENMEKRKYELVYTIDDLNCFFEIGENNPYFGVTLDFAHFSSHGITSPDLSKLKLPVHNVHMSQGVNGKMHFPLTVPNGMVDVAEACRVLIQHNYDGFAVFEMLNDQKESKLIIEKICSSLKEV